ncbi:MAG: hypothetical protein P9M08_02170 [Candidatus Erginobacter occultus]|nr:hypothetical protein [Candidatus Erginobacter occultus]
MERKSLFRLSLHLLWGFLIVVVLLLFFRERLGNIPGFFRRLKREPQALVSVFKPREMAGVSFSFADPGDLEVWKTSGASLEAVPALWGTDETWVRVTYRPSGSPGLLLTDETMGVMDWRGAESLSFSVYNPQTWTVNLKIKVKDTSGHSFQRDQEIPARTRTAVTVPVRDIASRLDLSRVGYLNLFLWEPATATDLYLIDFSFPAPGLPRPPAGLVKFMGLQFPSSVRPGEEVEAVFYFLVNRQLSGDNTLLLRLRQGETLFPLGRIDPPTPTSRWRPGRLAKVGPFPVAIPAALPPGTYDLEAILAQPVFSVRGEELVFQPYDNPEIEGFQVSEINVTAGGGM